MKMFKSSVLWALVVLVCLAQDVSARRLIFVKDKCYSFLRTADFSLHTIPEYRDRDVFAIDEDGELNVFVSGNVSRGTSSSWQLFLEKDFAVIDLPDDCYRPFDYLRDLGIVHKYQRTKLLPQKTWAALIREASDLIRTVPKEEWSTPSGDTSRRK